MNIHISIDDVINSLRWLTHNKPESIFDMRFFKALRDWHRQYDAKFSLYIFTECNNFIISEIPDIYADEFKASKSWLRFGYHGNTGDVQFKNESCYKEGFKLVDGTLTRLGAGRTNTLRLHCWHATPEQKEWLADKGVSELLYPDDEPLFNDADSFAESGLTHLRTRVRFENVNDITAGILYIGLPEVYAFTHEWCFDEQAPKIETALDLYSKSGYTFI